MFKKNKLEPKIAIIINDYSQMGGVEKVTSNLSNLFFDNNMPIWGIISLHKEFAEPKIIYNSRLNVYVISTLSLFSFLKNSSITHVIIQAQDLKQSCLIASQSKLLGLHIVTVLHSSPYPYLKKLTPNNSFKDVLRNVKMKIYTRNRNLLYFRILLTISNKFLTVSSTANDELKSLIPSYYHNKLDYIYNPVMLHYNNPETKSNVISYVGRLSRDKRVFFVVKNLCKILDKREDWEFIILGEGEEYNEIKHFIGKRKLNNIKLLGRIDNVEKYLLKSKISILYSYSEGLPTSLLEALYTGNVLISADSKGGAKDIIMNGDNGFIVNDEFELLEAVNTLVNNNDLIKKMSRNNYNYKDKFDSRDILKKWKIVLNL